MGLRISSRCHGALWLSMQSHQALAEEKESLHFCAPPLSIGAQVWQDNRAVTRMSVSSPRALLVLPGLAFPRAGRLAPQPHHQTHRAALSGQLGLVGSDRAQETGRRLSLHLQPVTL